MTIELLKEAVDGRLADVYARPTLAADARAGARRRLRHQRLASLIALLVAGSVLAGGFAVTHRGSREQLSASVKYDQGWSRVSTPLSFGVGRVLSPISSSTQPRRSYASIRGLTDEGLEDPTQARSVSGKFGDYSDIDPATKQVRQPPVPAWFIVYEAAPYPKYIPGGAAVGDLRCDMEFVISDETGLALLGRSGRCY